MPVIQVKIFILQSVMEDDMKRRFKGIISIMLASTMMIGYSGCGKNVSTESKTDEAVTEAETEEAT